jgi:2'-5' RNA ligase
MITDHQRQQLQVIKTIEEQVKNQSLQFSTVAPVRDYENDPRICLTTVHFPRQDLIQQTQQSIIDPLRQLEPEHYYYPPESLHMTIKNLRIIQDPPPFDDAYIEKAKKVIAEIIPKHRRFNAYFYRLLLFPNNLSLIGTTDPELDSIILDLNASLEGQGIPDDKVYANDKYFFCNMTLVRFSAAPSNALRKKIDELSAQIVFSPYMVDDVTLVSCNAAFQKLQKYHEWSLQ